MVSYHSQKWNKCTQIGYSVSSGFGVWDINNLALVLRPGISSAGEKKMAQPVFPSCKFRPFPALPMMAGDLN